MAQMIRKKTKDRKPDRRQEIRQETGNQTGLSLTQAETNERLHRFNDGRRLISHESSA